MRAGRIVAVIIGALLGLVGLGAAACGSAMVVVHGTQRDSAGYYTSAAERVQTSTAVLVTRLDLGAAPRSSGQGPAFPLGTVRVTATPVAGGGPLFIGIAREDRVDAWLAGTRHERITNVRLSPFGTSTDLNSGERAVPPPTAQDFWA